MADRDEDPSDVRHTGCSRDREIPALIGNGYLGRTHEFRFTGQLGLRPAARIRGRKRVEVYHVISIEKPPEGGCCSIMGCGNPWLLRAS